DRDEREVERTESLPDCAELGMIRGVTGEPQRVAGDANTPAAPERAPCIGKMSRAEVLRRRTGDARVADGALLPPVTLRDALHTEAVQQRLQAERRHPQSIRLLGGERTHGSRIQV